MAYDVTPARYVSSGPLYPGETPDDAMTANTLHHLAGHLLTRQSLTSAPTPAPAPGHGFEHEPLDAAEKAGQHTAQNATTYNHAATAAWIRSALRPGS